MLGVVEGIVVLDGAALLADRRMLIDDTADHDEIRCMIQPITVGLPALFLGTETENACQ